MNKSKLIKIWKQVPADYYQKSVKNNFLQRYWHMQKISVFRNVVGKRKIGKLLDVGCASGYMTDKIAQIFPESKIWGIDIYREAIKFGKKTYPHIQFKVADAENLPFRNNYFDLVVCYETIEHVLNPTQTLNEIKRVLKKNGYAIVAMDSGNLLFRLVWFIWENTKGRVWQNAHLHPFKHNNLEKLLNESGFLIQAKKFSHFGLEVVFLLKKRSYSF